MKRVNNVNSTSNDLYLFFKTIIQPFALFLYRERKSMIFVYQTLPLNYSLAFSFKISKTNRLTVYYFAVRIISLISIGQSPIISDIQLIMLKEFRS